MSNKTTALIEFKGVTLEAVSEDGMPFANLRRMCEELGLNYSSQHAKLKNKHWATMAIIATVGGDGKDREMVFMSADTIPMWLANINDSKVHADLRPSLRVMQLEAKDVLYSHFGGDIRANGITLSTMQNSIETLQGQVTELIQQMADQQKSLIELHRELVPVIKRIDEQTAGRRRQVALDTKRALVLCVQERYGGLCPCCKQRTIVVENKRVPDVTEIDHYHHRSMAGAEYVWLVCKTCNRKLRNRKPDGYWMKSQPSFQDFQRMLHEVLRPKYDPQLALF